MLLAAPAEVAELEDALRSGRSEVPPRVGSSPTFGTTSPPMVPSQRGDEGNHKGCPYSGHRLRSPPPVSAGALAPEYDVLAREADVVAVAHGG